MSELTRIERQIIDAVEALRREGCNEFTAVIIAKTIKEMKHAWLLPAFGRIYQALDHLEGLEILTGFWEERWIAESEERPRRRCYRLTSQ